MDYFICSSNWLLKDDPGIIPVIPRVYRDEKPSSRYYW